jgi:hypothetical protein
MANPEIRDYLGKLRNLLEDSTIVDIIKAVWKCQETNAHLNRWNIGWINLKERP